MIVGLLMVAGGAAAGVFGSLLGLGGGILIVPLLTLGFGLPLREAVGVSLVCVIMTSSAAAGVYLERHVANLRLGMTLELFTAFGALVGGSIAFLLDERLLSLPVRRAPPATSRSRWPAVAAPSADDRARAGPDADDAVPRAPAPADALDQLSGEGYHVRNLGRGVVGATGAGIASALLGIGGGIIKVPLMHLSMGVPLRVATATSNMMIGITAAASARHLPAPRRDRPVRRRPDRDRRVHRRDGRVAAGAPGRPPLPAAPVRHRARLHRRPDAAAGVT